MIEKIQRRFILIAMVSLLVIIIAIMGFLNGMNFYTITSDADGILSILAENGGKFPEPEKRIPRMGQREPGHLGGFQMTEETRFETRYFFATFDESATTGVNIEHIAAISSQQAYSYASKALSSKKDSGYVDNFRYLVYQGENGAMVLFLDRQTQLQSATSLLIVSGGIALISMLAMFLLVYLLSRRAIAPMVESLHKQRRFITDAGHEIKTPLAIISANADVIEIENGPGEWTQSIRNQTERLGRLVANLLILSRMDEARPALNLQEISLSTLLSEIIEDFAPLAQTQGKALLADIQRDILYKGDPDALRELFSILIDNALKYSSGDIRISLKRPNKKIHFDISNPADNLEAESTALLFDRFYRPGGSRDRASGGYGLGLSIAKAIVEAHRGRISAHSDDGAILHFTVSL